MYISSLQLANFKSYTGENNLIHFSPAVNYLVGNNNSGKSTILEAIDFIHDGKNYDTEDIKAKNAEGDQFYIEMCLRDKKGEMAKLIDKAASQQKSISEKAANDFKSLISEVKSKHDTEECITIRRFFKSKEDAKDLYFLDTGKEKDASKEPAFSNSSNFNTLFKKIFLPNFFRATDTPSDILNFASTKPLGRLINHEADGFFKSEAWAQFQKAHRETFSSENGYISRLKSLETLLGNMTSEHFNKDAIQISFKFESPDLVSFVKQGHLTVNDGSTETNLESKGNGLQRAVAFSVIRIYANMMKPDNGEPENKSQGLFLCVDEPEIWMHPKAQQQLAEALNTISATEQVFIATHSPYMLQAFNVDPKAATKSKKQIEDKLYICLGPGEPRSDSRFEPSKDLGHIHPGNPSLAEITYFAFQMATPEFHNELVGYIQAKLGISTLAPLDKLFVQDYGMSQVYKRFDSRCLDWNCCAIACETLPIHIRNLIDHPESIGEKDKAKKEYEKDQEKWSKKHLICKVGSDHKDCTCPHCIKCEHEFTWENIEAQDNTYTLEELEDSIRLLLKVIQKNPQWKNSTSTQGENVPVSGESVR